MQVATVQAASEDVRTFIQEYFDAWKAPTNVPAEAEEGFPSIAQIPGGVSATRNNFAFGENHNGGKHHDEDRFALPSDRVCLARFG